MNTNLLYILKTRDLKLPFIDYDDDLKEFEEEEGGAIDVGITTVVLCVMAVEVFLLLMLCICPLM